MYTFFIQLMVLWSVLSTGMQEVAHIEKSVSAAAPAVVTVESVVAPLPILSDEDAIHIQESESVVYHVYREEASEPKQLDRINGITLLHSEQEVRQQLGPPVTISQEPLLPERFVYYYADMNVGIANGMIDYIEVPAEVGHFTLNENTELSINLDALQHYFGKPYHVAQDGVVFEKHGMYVKAFYDREDPTRIDAVHFFLGH